MQITQKLLCEAANVMPDGRLNVLGAFTRLNFMQFPVLRGIVLVARVTVAELERHDEHKVNVHIVDQDGKPICPAQQTIIKVPPMLPPGDTEVNVMVAFGNVPIARPGTYRVDISLDNRMEMEPFQVFAVPPTLGFPLLPPAQDTPG